MELGEESLNIIKHFRDQVKIFHPTTEFTAEYLKEKVNFLDVNIKLINDELKKFVF